MINFALFILEEGVVWFTRLMKNFILKKLS